MGNNDCCVVMTCFWELSFIPGCICVVVWLGLGFVFTQTHSLEDISTAEHGLHYTSFQQSDLSPVCVPLTPEVSGQAGPTVGLGP